MKVIVSKLGSVFRTRAASGGASASGEQGETEGLLRWLVAQGHDVTFFGRSQGEVPGVRMIEPSQCFTDDDVEGDQSSLWDAQLAGFQVDQSRLDRDYGLYLQMTGYAACGSFRMPHGRVRIQMCAAKYIAPVLNATIWTGAPRVLVNTDPRCYPRDWEMTRWPELQPKALLDQCDRTTPMRVGGVHFTRRSVRARCESWAYHERRANRHLDPAVCVAHAHVHDGIGKSSWDAWELIHGGELPDEYHVYGKGWESSGLPPGVWGGAVNPWQALELFNMHTCGPVVSHTPGFDTGKPYVMHSQGCVPLLFGDGHYQTYDPQGHILPLDHPCRLRGPGDLAAVARELHEDEQFYHNVMADLDESLKPDFTVLEELIDYGPSFERFGGYRPS